MPKRCSKRKQKKLKQLNQVNQKGRDASRSLKQTVADFFQRITTRSVDAEPKSCSNNNNFQKYETHDRGDPGMNPFLEEVRNASEKDRDDKNRKEGEIKVQSKQSVYDAYQNLYKQRNHDNVTPSFLLSGYAKGRTFLSSTLIEMYNNEPYLQTVPIYTISNNSDTQTETQPRIHEMDDHELSYSVGRTVYTGSFNLKVLDILEESTNVTTYDVDTDARRQTYRVVKRDPASMAILDILNEGSATPVIENDRESTGLVAKVAKSPSDMKFLIHEYGVTAPLCHANILTPYCQIPNGFLLEKMSENLDSHIRENFDTTQMKIPLRDKITTGLLKAVSHLHSKLIAHLDITPENILLTADGIPKLTNFSHARRVRDGDGQQNSVTASRGRIPFLCPEILAQKPVNNLTAVDAWAVGVVMYYMFTGGLLPFEGDSAEEVYNNQIQGAEWVPHRVRSKMINDISFTKFYVAMFLLMNFEANRRPSIDSVLKEISTHK